MGSCSGSGVGSSAAAAFARIFAGVAGQTGGTTLANTYVANAAAWGPGSTITFMFNGTFWKVK